MESFEEPHDEYEVKWLVNALGFKNKSGEMRGVSPGFCEMNPEKIARLCPAGGLGGIAPFTVRDVLVSKDGACEERGRCLYFDCEHNEASLRSLRGSNGWVGDILETENDLQNFKEKLRRIEEVLEEEITELDWGSDSSILYREPALVLHPHESGEDSEGRAVSI